MMLENTVPDGVCAQVERHVLDGVLGYLEKFSIRNNVTDAKSQIQLVGFGSSSANKLVERYLEPVSHAIVTTRLPGPSSLATCVAA
jgi:hypothetical protein